LSINSSSEGVDHFQPVIFWFRNLVKCREWLKRQYKFVFNYGKVVQDFFHQKQKGQGINEGLAQRLFPHQCLI